MHDILDAGLLVHVLPDCLDRNIRGACTPPPAVLLQALSVRARASCSLSESKMCTHLHLFCSLVLLQLTRISRLELHDDKITGVIPGKRCGGRCGGGKFEIDLPDDSPMSIQDLVSFSCR